MADTPEYRAKNRVRIRAYMKNYVAERVRKDPAYHRERSLKTKYGLTVLQFMELAEAQEHKCALCGRVCGVSERSGYYKLCVDHDHSTGQIRGLLCHFCNSLLGRFNDDPVKIREWAERISQYLDSSR